ncbi:MAG: hypothetical protein ACE5IR_02935 [bacterium]
MSVLFPILFVGLSSCSGDLPVQGFNPDDGFDPDNKGSISNVVIGTMQEVAFSDTTTVTGRSPFLLLGAFQDIETRILMKFEDIPDSMIIRTATILLRTNALLGETNTKGRFTATVHNVMSDWGDSTVTDESFGDAYEASSIGSVEMLSVDRGVAGIDSVDVETVRIELNEMGLDAIRDTTSLFRQHGVLIDFENSTFIKEFFSQNNQSRLPQLLLTVDGDSIASDRVFVDVAEDAFIVKQLVGLPQGPLYVDNIFSHQFVIKFDLSNIPRESTINKAKLDFNVIPELSVLPGHTLSSTDGITVQINRLQETYNPANTIRIDSTFTPILAVVNPSDASLSLPRIEFTALFRLLFQQWVSQDVENHGFVMRTFTPGFNVSRVAFGSTVNGSESGPKLELDFTVAPTNP